LLTETRRAGVPTVLLNGRMSERSVRRWAWAPDAAASLLGGFVLCLATSRLEADRLTALGAVVKTIGNLKDAGVPLPVNRDELGALRGAIGTRPVWMAASTHPSEEEAVAAVHVKLASGHPRLLTIVAPRHPERGSQLALSLR